MERNSSVRRRAALAGAAAVAVLLTACGGGGGGGSSTTPPAPNPPPPNPPPSGGVDRGGLAIGTITGFGSIFVNGVEYETDQAQITVDDNPGQESDLAVGHVVRVTGTVSDDGLTGDAETVVFENDIEGPVQSIDVVGSRLVVAGQTVLVDSATVFDDDIVPQSLDGLAVDDFVEVSGFFDADGRLAATRIERDNTATEVEIKGFVANLDAAAFTFTIGGLTVDYSSANLDDFGAGGPADGDFVEVKGTAFGAGGELIATEVEAEDDGVDGDDGDAFEVEGFITAFVSAEDFAVNGQPVITTTQTEFENGTAGDLALNVKVEVEGAFDGNGTLVAEKVEIKLASNLRVSAPVDAVDVAAKRLTVLGIDVRVDDVTQLEDDSQAEVTFFGLDDLAVGDFVEVRGATDAEEGADILATRIERDDDENEVELRGFVESVDTVARSLVILGVTVTTEVGNSAFDAFFNAVAPGDLVEAEGTTVGDGVIAADELEFENEETNDGSDDDDGGSDDDTEVSGAITAIVSATEFEIGTQTVLTNADTEYEDGTAADLAVGVDVAVEGTLDGDGALVADKVDFDYD